MIDDESRLRTEEPSQDEEKKGLLRPLPQGPSVARPKSGVPMVVFLGITMKEKTRDFLVAVMMPLFASIVDAAVYMAVVVQWVPDDMIYMFLIPMAAAIPIGLVVGQTSKALISAIGAGILFLFILSISLSSPAFVAPAESIGDFFFSSLVFSSIYFLFVVFASLVGTVIGIVMREFL